MERNKDRINEVLEEEETLMQGKLTRRNFVKTSAFLGGSVYLSQLDRVFQLLNKT